MGYTRTVYTPSCGRLKTTLQLATYSVVHTTLSYQVGILLWYICRAKQYTYMGNAIGTDTRGRSRLSQNNPYPRTTTQRPSFAEGVLLSRNTISRSGGGGRGRGGGGGGGAAAAFSARCPLHHP